VNLLPVLLRELMGEPNRVIDDAQRQAEIESLSLLVNQA